MADHPSTGPSAGTQSAGQPVSGEPGSGESGSGQAGSGQAGSGESGSGQAGSGQPASGQAGSGQPGSGRYGQDTGASGRSELGRGAPAGWGRRVAALLIDWLLANLAAFAIVRDPSVWQAPVTAIDFVPLAIFWLELWLMTAFVGASIGQRVRHLLVVRLDGQPVGLVRAFVRSALILVVLPPLIPAGDGRGLHDRLAGTVLVRAR